MKRVECWMINDKTSLSGWKRLELENLKGQIKQVGGVNRIPCVALSKWVLSETKIDRWKDE